MKQKQQSKKTSGRNSRKIWIIGASAVLAILFLAQMTFNVYVYQNLASTSNPSAIIHAIINASRSLHKPAPVEPTTGKVYLPEVRLVLPAPDSLRHLLYSNPTEQEVQITTSDILNEAETKLWTSGESEIGVSDKMNAVFTEVPNLMACSRGVQLFFAPQDFDDPKVQLQATKTLANGKTIYLYTESTCKGNLTELAEYVKQAQSY